MDFRDCVKRSAVADAPGAFAPRPAVLLQGKAGDVLPLTMPTLTGGTILAARPFLERSKG